MNADLLVLGLNPAWQRLFLLDELVPGRVHRLPCAQEFASGKGINFSRVFSRLGHAAHGLQFAGGSNGARILQELEAADVEQSTVSIRGETRICTTYASAAGESTELIEPSPVLHGEEGARFWAALQPLWDAFDRIVLCGTAPTGFDWTKLCSADIRQKVVYLDAWTGVEPWLEQGVELLKVNGEELGKLLGMDADPECLDVFALGKQAMARFALRNLVVTQGARRVLVFHQEMVYTLCPPRATPFVNAIGAGDAFLAGWIAADLEGLNLVGKLVRAVAVSVARCEVDLPWNLSLPRVARIESECLPCVEEIPWNS